MTFLEQCLRQSRLLHLAMLSSTAMLGGSMLFLVASGKSGQPVGAANFNQILQIAVPVVCIGSVFMAMLLRAIIASFAAKKISDSRDDDAIERLIGQSFVQATLVTAALLEGSAILAAVASLLTRNVVYLGGTAFGLVALTAFCPTSAMMARWAQRVAGGQS